MPLIRSLIRRVLDPPQQDPEVDRLLARVAALEAELAVSQHKNGDYFALIERILAQRDVWKDMFNEHSREHLAGQTLLEVKLNETRQMLGNALRMLNRYRADKKEPPVDGPMALEPDAPPIGTAEAFAKKMAALLAAAPGDVDGVKERDRIAAAPEGP